MRTAISTTDRVQLGFHLANWHQAVRKMEAAASGIMDTLGVDYDTALDIANESLHTQAALDRQGIEVYQDDDPTPRGKDGQAVCVAALMVLGVLGVLTLLWCV